MSQTIIIHKHTIWINEIYDYRMINLEYDRNKVILYSNIEFKLLIRKIND